MKLPRVVLLCGITLVSAWIFGSNKLHAEQVIQFPNGFVLFRGGPESELLTILTLSNGDMQLVYDDITNGGGRVWDLPNVTGLSVDMKGGENVVDFHGSVIVNGNFTVISEGGCRFRSESNGSDSLFVNGDFNFFTGDGSDTFLCSIENDVINVAGDMNLLTGDFGVEDVRIGNCHVAGDCQIRTAGGFDHVILGVNQNDPQVSVEGISTGGDLMIHSGIGGYRDFVVCVECLAMGDLLIVTGVGDDQVSLRDSSVFGKTTIKTGRDDDLVICSGAILRGALYISSGAGHDIVEIGNNSDILNGGTVYLKNGDDQLRLTSSSFWPTFFVHGGSGFDTAFESNSTFGKGLGAQYFEERNF